MIKNLFISIALLLLGTTVFGQAGAKFYTGVTTAFNKDEIVTPSGTVHSGWIIGIDARLNSDRMYFLIGGLYGKADLIATSSPTFFAKDQMSFFKGRIGLGFDMIRISPKLFITSKVAGSINYIIDYPKELLTTEGYKILNDGTAGLVGGIGVKIGSINIDFEYEYGLFNLIPKKPDSNMSYISLTGGINF